MSVFSRRNLLKTLALTPFPLLGLKLGKIFATSHAPKADLGPVPVENGDLPHRPAPKPIESPKVTDDMTVELTALLDDNQHIVALAKDFRLAVVPKPGRPKSRTEIPVFNATSLSSAPAGEFVLDGVVIGSPDSKHQILLEVDEMQAPGASGLAQGEYVEAIRFQTNKTDFLVKSNGAVVRLLGVERFNVHEGHTTAKGSIYRKVTIVAQSAVRIQ